MAGVLRIDQDDDITLEYVQAFRDHLLFAGFAHRYLHHSLVEIKNADVNRSRVDDMLKAKSIDYITAAGHGVYDSFTGQRSAVVWSAAEDLSYLHDKIVHLLSCQTDAILGRMMVKHGVSAFWGYTVKFMFYHQNPPPAPLHQDKLAEAFLRMDIID
jgi:hypothetical protein